MAVAESAPRIVPSAADAVAVPGENGLEQRPVQELRTELGRVPPPGRQRPRGDEEHGQNSHPVATVIALLSGEETPRFEQTDDLQDQRREKPRAHAVEEQFRRIPQPQSFVEVQDDDSVVRMFFDRAEDIVGAVTRFDQIIDAHGSRHSFDSNADRTFEILRIKIHASALYLDGRDPVEIMRFLAERARQVRIHGNAQLPG